LELHTIIINFFFLNIYIKKIFFNFIYLYLTSIYQNNLKILKTIIFNKKKFKFLLNDVTNTLTSQRHALNYFHLQIKIITTQIILENIEVLKLLAGRHPHHFGIYRQEITWTYKKIAQELAK